MLNLKSQLFNFLKNIISRISITRRQYYWITVVACFFIAAIIVTGASVRVTGSGLGCTTWPKCTAESFAPTKEQSGHSTIEWANRLFTGAVSLSVMVAVLGSLMLKHRSKRLTWLSIGLVFGIIAQIILGGITVLVKLNPLAVGAHMIVSLLLLANAVILCYCTKQEREVSLKKLFQPSANFLLYIVTNFIVIAGIVVTAAGPHAGDQNVPRLDAGIQTVVRIHSGLAWIFTLLMLVLFFVYKNHSWQLKALFLVTLCQIAWGYSQYFNGIPAWMVIIHVFLAALLYMFSCLNWTRSLNIKPTCAV